MFGNVCHTISASFYSSKNYSNINCWYSFLLRIGSLTCHCWNECQKTEIYIKYAKLETVYFIEGRLRTLVHGCPGTAAQGLSQYFVKESRDQCSVVPCSEPGYIFPVVLMGAYSTIVDTVEWTY